MMFLFFKWIELSQQIFHTILNRYLLQFLLNLCTTMNLVLLSSIYCFYWKKNKSNYSLDTNIFLKWLENFYYLIVLIVIIALTTVLVDARVQWCCTCKLNSVISSANTMRFSFDCLLLVLYGSDECWYEDCWTFFKVSIIIIKLQYLL